MFRQTTQQRLFSTLDHIVAVVEKMSKDIKKLKADNRTLRLELPELASRVDSRNPATKSAVGLLPIDNEEDYQRVNEALQEEGLFEEMVCSVYFLNVILGHLSRGSGRPQFECVRAKRDGRYIRPNFRG